MLPSMRGCASAIDALVHLGTHGTLEWLPGKALALSAECWPEVVLGPLPVIYPFIVNNPGEAVQAKRRLRRRHHRPSDAAAQRRRPARAARRAGRHHRGICRGRRPRPPATSRFLEDEIVERAWTNGLGRRLRPGEGRAQPPGRRRARRPALRHQGAQHPRRPARLRPIAGRGDDAPAGRGDRRGGRGARLGRLRARRARWPPSTRAAWRRAGRRAEPRPRRRAADRPQPHLDRSARHPDAHRRRDRRARCRRGGAALPAGSRRAAARAGDRISGPRPRCAPAATISRRRCGTSA